MNNTKNNYKEEINNLSYNELIDEQTKIKRELMKGNVLKSKKSNAYGNMKAKTPYKGYNIKLLKWKYSYICNKLHQMSDKN